MISFNSIVGYRSKRLCSGAILPVRFWNCQGGSARIVEYLSDAFARRSSAGVGWGMLTIFVIQCILDSENQHGTASATTTLNLRKQQRRYQTPSQSSPSCKAHYQSIQKPETSVRPVSSEMTRRVENETKRRTHLPTPQENRARKWRMRAATHESRSGLGWILAKH